jgi:hypothetical protein
MTNKDWDDKQSKPRLRGNRSKYVISTGDLRVCSGKSAVFGRGGVTLRSGKSRREKDSRFPGSFLQAR